MLIEFNTEKLSPEDRRILSFIGSIGQNADLPTEPRDTTASLQVKLETATKGKVATKKTAKSAPKKTATKSQALPTDTSEIAIKDIRQEMTKKVPTHRAEIKEYFKKIDISNLAEVTENQYADLHAFLKNLA
jgi:hypothetical protein